MAKFSMADLLNNRSKESSSNKNAFKIKNISINQIVPDSNNFYTVDDVTELKESIFMFGLQQNLVVRDIPGTDTFKLISGHRRLKALTMLVEEGHEDFGFAPCKVETDIDEIKAELQLIFANSTSRELSDYEKTHQAMRMKKLLTSLKSSGVKLTGRMRELVADTLKVSTAQVGRMESINNNLTPDFQEEFKNNKVNFSTAYELSGLEKKEQEEAYKEFKDKGTLSIKDVKNRKAVEEKQETKYEGLVVTTIVTEDKLKFEININSLISGFNRSPNNYDNSNVITDKRLEFANYVARQLVDNSHPETRYSPILIMLDNIFDEILEGAEDFISYKDSEEV